MIRYFILLLALGLGTGNITFAQDYKETLGKTLQDFFEQKTQPEKINQSNRLGLIAKKFDTEWSGAYYAALSKILLNYDENDAQKKDAYLDEAEDFLADATRLADKNNSKQQSEIYALTAMLANARIGVNPQKRWQKYGKIFEENLEKAKEKNPENPRIYFLKGTSIFYTPKMFGGGKKKSLEYFERAATFFDKEQEEDIEQPFWGKEVNEEYVKMAKGED